jgi:putative phosphoesterase
MTITVGLVSDIHADPAPLSEALELFERHGVDLILCAGDIAGYGDSLDETVRLLADSQCQSIMGNHEIWYQEESEATGKLCCRYISSLPRTREFVLAGQKVFMVHASPPDAYTGGIRLLDKQCEIDPEQVQYWKDRIAGFDYDVLIVGHTHQVFAEHLGSTLVINPGSTTYNHSCAILTLPQSSVSFHALSGKGIKRCWNWAEQFKD